MYNPKSKKAEEFINHEEILETLAYADAHKDDAALIDQIIAKTRLKKRPLPPGGLGAPGLYSGGQKP